jgi:hypothetical protein
MKAVVFLGPSLPLADAREILDAVYLPPVQQADLISALRTYRPDVVGLIDGEFGQALSVWHKEILFALQEGVRIYGASSMGALRAAEADVFGMIGVGRIYRMFRDGELTDDDEVAVAHGRVDAGYRLLSEPMVNIRATLEDGVAAGVVDAALAARLTRMAKSCFFPDRSFRHVFRMAEEEGVSPALLAPLRTFVREHYRDVKREDALELLRTIRDLPEDAPPPRVPEPIERTNSFETLYQRDRTVRHNGTDVRLYSVAEYAALQMPDFTTVRGHGLNRVLAGVLADLLGLHVDDAAVEAEARRFRVRRGLSDPAAFADWLRRNDLEPAEFPELMHGLAEARAMQQWVTVRQGAQGVTRGVLDELRLRGEYEAMAERAAAQHRLLSEHYPDVAVEDTGEIDTLELVRDHMRATPCRMDTSYAQWREDAGFLSVESFRAELLRARVAREHLTRLARQAAEGLPTSAPALAEAS